MSEISRVLVVLHGDRVDVSELPHWAQHANAIVAADGGVEYLLNAGISPDVVTGDFDGLVESVRANLPSEILVLNDDQNTTDCQKALAMARERFGATDVVVFGAEGTRIDHMMSTLGACAASGVGARAIFASSIAHFVRAGAKLECGPPVGTLVSLMPLVATRIASTAGLKWDATGLTLALGERDGVSNVATEDKVRVEVESGILAVFVGRFEGDIRW